MTGIRLELKGQEAALAELGQYEKRARDPQGMYENIGAMLTTSTQHRFDTGIGVDGSPWPPSLRVLKHGGKTLVRTARLYRSFAYQAFAGGLEFGTNVIYAAIQQWGGDIHQHARTAVLHFKTNARTGQTRFAKPGKADRARKAEIGAHTVHLPARPFVGLDAEDDRAILNIAEKWLAGEAVTQS